MNSAPDVFGIQETAEPATIFEAYNELSQEAFAIWMRLLVCTETQLKAGRKAISVLLGYSEGRSNVILRELKHKGYITFHPADRPGLPTRINVRRGAIISGPARITRLGREGTPKYIRKTDDQGHSLKSVLSDFPQMSYHENGKFSISDTCNAQQVTIPAGRECVQIDEVNKDTVYHHEIDKPHLNGTHEIPEKKKHKKQKFLGLGGGYASNQNCGSKPSSPQISSGALYTNSVIDLDKIREKKKTEKQRRKQVEKRAYGKTANGDTANGKKGKSKQELAKLDARGKPIVKFDCTQDERKSYIAILDRAAQSPLKKQFLAKIETEVTRIYTRYRRESDQLYLMYPSEKKYMRDFGELCIRRSVTPAQVLSYWKEHIGEFIGIDIIPPHFLKSPANIDTASIAVMASTKGGKSKWKADSFKENKTPVHSYSDTRRLHPDLRSGLESAGFDTSAYSDRYLMSVQSPAKDLAAGHKPFISSKIRPMAEWAAKHIFKALIDAK